MTPEEICKKYFKLHKINQKNFVRFWEPPEPNPMMVTYEDVLGIVKIAQAEQREKDLLEVQSCMDANITDEQFKVLQKATKAIREQE